MRLAFALLPLLNLLLQAQAADDPEAALRAAVQQYYEAQSQRDPDKAAAFWSSAAMPRPTRDSFIAMFGPPAEDSITVEVRRVEIEGAEARVRVFAVRTRLIVREGTTSTQRQTFPNSQRWRREAAGWKLLRDGPFAEEVADELMAAAAADRPALYEKYRADLVQARLLISQRATMTITLTKDNVKGRSLFELALEVSRIANDRHGQANSLHNIAQASYFLGDHAAATDGYEKELALGREIPSDDVAASALFGLATVSYSRAEYTPALGFYREALAIYEKSGDGSAIGRAVVSIGNVQYLQAEYDVAAASYRRALAALEGAQDQQGAAFARSGLARVYTAQGDLAAALEMYGRVLADGRLVFAADPRTKAQVANPLESIGEIYYRLGNADQARTNFEEARKLFDGDPASQGRISASLGLTELIAGRYDAALAAYNESRAKFEVAKLPEGVARAWVGVGFSHAAREKYGDAIAAYKTAITMFEAQKRNEDSGRAWLGLSLAQSGLLDHEAALVSARKVRVIADGVKSEDLAWRSSVRIGEALRKLKRLDEAKTEFQAAIAAIDSVAGELPINPDARGQLDDSAGAWTGLAMALAASGQPREALDAAEARRAHIRRVQFAAFHRDIARGMTPEEQAEEQGLTREIISARNQLRAERTLRRPDPERIERLQQQVAALLEKRATQQARLYERLPELRILRGLGAPVVPAAAFPLQGDGEILVEYLFDEDELLAITMARGEDGPAITATLTPIHRRDLAEQVAQALQPASLEDPETWRTRTAPIAAAVLAPIERHLATRDSIIVIPDDLLWRLPFEALMSGDAVLAARMRVRYATSIATLGRQHAAGAVASAETKPSAERITAAILAAPEIPPAVKTQITLAQSGWKPPDEEAALARAASLAAVYGDAATVRAKAEASEQAARAAITAADVVHFAAPFQASGATPLFSFFVLSASGETLGGDGRWEVREWLRADAPVARARVMIVADGASFGLGVGGTMDALAWASAALGVPTLIVARAPADAFKPDALLAALHRELAKGAAPGAAWTSAVSAVRATSPAPLGWTGLRLLGPG